MTNLFNDEDNVLALEELMYILFIFASFISINATNELKEANNKQFYNQSGIQEQYILANYIFLIVFITFLIRNYKVLEKLDINSEEYKYAKATFIGSLLTVIGQILIIYYFSNTTTYKKECN